MLSIPPPRGGSFYASLTGRPAATLGVLVTGGGSSHALGSFATIASATEFDSWAVALTFHSTMTAATQTDALLNIYIGGSGNETLLIPSMLAGWVVTYADSTERRPTYLPLHIPAGSRLTAKCQGLQTNKTMYVGLRLFGGGQPPHWVGRGVEALGVNIGSSRGTNITPGTTSEGTFVNMGTSTYDYGYVLPMLQGGGSDVDMAEDGLGVDVGVGDALYRGLENFTFHNAIDERVSRTFAKMGAATRIPAGTTLQLRGQYVGASTDVLDAALYGVF